MLNKIETNRGSKGLKPAKGVHVLFSVPNKKTKFWGIITGVNTGYNGAKTYTVVRHGNGESFTINEKQIVRTAEAGEKLTLTQGGSGK